MTHASLFSGQGGFDLAAEWAGWENIFHCEINTFCKPILKYYFHNSTTYDNIKTTDFTIHRGGIDVLTGGFPCQPYSVAGQQRGTEDDRHLWPEMLRAIREIRPRWVVGENVRGLVSWQGGLVFDQVQLDLEAEGYEVLPFLLPACSVNAPHRRDRIWFVAHRLTADTDAGQCGRQESEIQAGRLATDRSVCNGTTPNTDKLNGWEQFEQPCNDRTGTRQEFGGCGDFTDPAYWSTADTNDQRSGSRPRCVQSADGEIPQRHDHAEPCDADTELAADTCRAGQQECNAPDLAARSGHGSGLSAENGNYWQNFPTQSPVCDGDDGLSARLDAAAVLGGKRGNPFPRWRNESIKAGGNAIVPQVVLQIFQAINEYENLLDASD